jgi:rhodanese-related sulfurtransferase
MMREITVEDLRRRMDGGEKPLLLDVRQPWENQLASLPGSVLVPLQELPVRAAEIKPAPGQQVVCYCHHGQRSLRAAMFLAQLGVEAVSLAGGIDAWSQRIDAAVPRY